jgi:hypothetical protein
MVNVVRVAVAAILVLPALAGSSMAADIDDRVKPGYADSNGVKIH